MATVNDSYQARIGVKGGKEVKAELRSVGAEGAKSFKQIESAAAQTTFGMRLVSRYIIGNLIPAFGSIRIGRSLINNIQALELADARLRRLSDSTDDFNKKQEYLSQTARRLNIDVVTLSDGYAKLLSLQKGGLLKDGQAEALLEGFANVKAALGASDTQIGQVLFGLSQALSSGTVRAEEFNQVTEPLPGLLQEMEKSAGLAAGDLRKLVNDGQVTSDYFGDVLVKALDSYAGAAENMSGTSVAAFTKLSNSWLDLSRTIGESGLVDVMSKTIGTLTIMVETASDLADEIGGISDKILEITRKNALGFSYRPRDPGYEKVDLGNQDSGTKAGLGQFESELRHQMKNLRYFTQNDYKFGGDLSSLFSSGNIVQPDLPALSPETDTEEQEKKRKAEAAAAKRAAEAIDSVTEALRFENEQMTRGEKDQILYNELRKAGVSLDSAAGQEISALVDQRYALNTAMEASAQRMERIQALSDSVGDAFSSAFGNAITQGNSLRDVLQGLAQDIAQIVYQETVGNQIKSSLSGIVSQALSGGFSGLFGGGKFTGVSAQMGMNAVYGAALDTIAGVRASGGPVAAGSSYLVGEKGPEIFTPKTSGSIIPNSLASAAGGGAIYIDARGSNDPAAVEAAVRRGISAATPHIVGLSVRRVSDLNSRNPGYLKR